MIRALFTSIVLIFSLACSTQPPNGAAVPPITQPTATPIPVDTQATVAAAVAGTVTALSVPLVATATAQALVVPTVTIVSPKWVIDAAQYLGSYPGAIDILSMSEVDTAIITRSQNRLDQLRTAGRVFDVYTGDEAVVVEALPTAGVRVRLLSGNAVGKTVWLPKNLVKQISP